MSGIFNRPDRLHQFLGSAQAGTANRTLPFHLTGVALLARMFRRLNCNETSECLPEPLLSLSSSAKGEYSRSTFGCTPLACPVAGPPPRAIFSSAREAVVEKISFRRRVAVRGVWPGRPCVSRNFRKSDRVLGLTEQTSICASIEEGHVMSNCRSSDGAKISDKRCDKADKRSSSRKRLQSVRRHQ